MHVRPANGYCAMVRHDLPQVLIDCFRLQRFYLIYNSFLDCSTSEIKELCIQFNDVQQEIMEAKGIIKLHVKCCADAVRC